MTKSFLVFPTGSAGIALFLMRLAVASALTAIIPSLEADILMVPTIVLAATLLAGFCVRAAAGIATVIGFAVCARLGGPLGVSAAIHGLCAAALSILGAGGYSIDARLFGRRVINLDR
jgi:hypothetical protein